MVIMNVSKCPNCGGSLRFYDRVKRVVIGKGRVKEQIMLRRFRCQSCRKIHREIPPDILPHKHYESSVVEGVIEKFITSCTKGFEDYPCEMTMNRWIKQYTTARKKQPTL